MNNLNSGRVVSINSGLDTAEARSTKTDSMENMTPVNNVVNLSKKIDLNNIKIVKKDGTLEEYNVQKVVNAVKKSAARMLVELSDEEIKNICEHVDNSVYAQRQDYIDISRMHCIVENALEDVNPKVA